MKRQHLYLLLLLPILGLLLNGCCHCPATGTPAFPNTIDLYNFSAAEVDSVIIKQYRSSSNFSNPADSAVYQGNYYDSTEYKIPFFQNGTYVPDTALNILVYFPKDGLTYKIANITTKTEYSRCCWDAPEVPYLVYTGYNLNGVPCAIPNNYEQSGLTITITK